MTTCPLCPHGTCCWVRWTQLSCIMALIQQTRRTRISKFLVCNLRRTRKTFCRSRGSPSFTPRRPDSWLPERRGSTELDRLHNFQEVRVTGHVAFGRISTFPVNALMELWLLPFARSCSAFALARIRREPSGEGIRRVSKRSCQISPTLSKGLRAVGAVGCQLEFF